MIRTFVLAAAFGVVLAACAHAGTALPPPSGGLGVNGREPARRCEPIFYKPVGASEPQKIKAHGPGLVLGGGGRDVNEEFVWMHDTVAGSRTRRAADLVVLRATGNNDYDRYIYRLAPYHSVRTLLLPRCSPPEALRQAADIIDRSSVVFFAGGDQADYVIWKDTPIQRAVQQLYDRGGAVGGTSAGEAILGDYVFDAIHDFYRDATSRNAVRHPYEKLISFTYGFLRFAPLAGVIPDMHFVTRNRFGRTAVFMARQIADGKVRGRSPIVLAVGVDEASGILIDKHGVGRLALQGKGGSAFMIRGGAARRLEADGPFISGELTVTKLSREGDRFDFTTWCGHEPTYTVRVNGRRHPMYVPPDPYVPPAGARVADCR